MSPLDEGFRKRIGSIYGVWRRSIFDALKRGQKNKTVREDIDSGAEASFLVAIMAGSASVGKVAQKLAFHRSCIQVARSHVESLLPS